MMRYSGKVSDVDEEIGLLKKASREHHPELVAAMQRGVESIAFRADTTVPHGPSGELAASQSDDVRLQAGDEIEGIVAYNDYKALWAEFGTEAHWPPPDRIAEKMGVEIWEGHLIARKISVSGTPASHFLYRAFKASQDEIAGFFRDALERIKAQMAL